MNDESLVPEDAPLVAEHVKAEPKPKPEPVPKTTVSIPDNWNEPYKTEAEKYMKSHRSCMVIDGSKPTDFGKLKPKGEDLIIYGWNNGPLGGAVFGFVMRMMKEGYKYAVNMKAGRKAGLVILQK